MTKFGGRLEGDPEAAASGDSDGAQAESNQATNGRRQCFEVISAWSPSKGER